MECGELILYCPICHPDNVAAQEAKQTGLDPEVGSSKEERQQDVHEETQPFVRRCQDRFRLHLSRSNEGCLNIIKGSS